MSSASNEPQHIRIDPRRGLKRTTIAGARTNEEFLRMALRPYTSRERAEEIVRFVGARPESIDFILFDNEAEQFTLDNPGIGIERGTRRMVIVANMMMQVSGHRSWSRIKFTAGQELGSGIVVEYIKNPE